MPQDGTFFVPGTDTALNTPTTSFSVGGGPGFGNIGEGIQGLATGVGSLIGGLATSAGDTASAQAYQQEAQLYQQAAAAAGWAQGAVTAGLSTGRNVQVVGVQRAAEMQIARGQAVEGAGGLMASGSSLNILQESQRQAAIAAAQARLQVQVEGNQFAMMQTAYEAEAAKATGAASAARSAAGAATAGGILGFLGSAAGAAAKIVPFL